MALSGIILHLIFANYFLQKFWYEPIFCFVLAPSKDLAVAPPYYYGILRQKVGALAFRPWRHCSHLAHYCVRLLAATFLSRPSYKNTCMAGGSSDFPLASSASNHLSCLSRLNIAEFQRFVK